MYELQFPKGCLNFKTKMSEESISAYSLLDLKKKVKIRMISGPHLVL